MEKPSYESLLADFDKQVALKIAEMRSACADQQAITRNLFMRAVLHLPKEIRLLKFDEVLKNGKSATPAYSVEAIVEKVVSNLTDKIPKIEPRAQRAVASKKSVAKRASSRPRGRITGVMQTPKTSSHLPSFITPKISTATPLHKTVLRASKPNEMLFSVKGSPVYAGPATIARNKARGRKGASEMIVSLGNGNTLVVPSHPPSKNDNLGVDLDDATKNQLLLLRSQIDNLIQKSH